MFLNAALKNGRKNKIEREFKKELKALLEKYDARICFEIGSDSGTYGLYDEEITGD